MGWHRFTVWEKLIVAIIVLAFAFGALCLVSWLGMLLWNAIVPSTVGWGAITFWQAMGIKLMITFILTPLSFKFGKNDED